MDEHERAEPVGEDECPSCRASLPETTPDWQAFCDACHDALGVELEQLLGAAAARE